MSSQDKKTSNARKIARLIDLKKVEIYDGWLGALKKKWGKTSDQKIGAILAHKKEERDLLSLLLKLLLGRARIGRTNLDTILNRIRTKEYTIFDFFLEASCLEESIKSALRGSNGIKWPGLSSNMDIIHRRLSSVLGAVLKETSEVYEYITECGDRAFCRMDGKGTIVHANQQMKQLLGHESVAGKHLSSFFKGKEREFVRETLSPKRRSRPDLRELRLIASDRQSKPVGVEIGPLIIGGKHRGGYACMVDLSRQMEVGNKVFDKSPLSVAKVNRSGEITYLNQKALEMLGLDRFEKKTLKDVFRDKKNLGIVEKQLKKRKRGLSNEYEVEVTRFSDKKRIPVMVSASPETDLGGNIIGTVAIVRNLAVQKTVEAIHRHIETIRDEKELLTAVAKEVERVIPFDFLGFGIYSSDMRHARGLLRYLPSGRFEIQKRWWEIAPQSRRFLNRKRIESGNLEDFLARKRWEFLKSDPDFMKIVNAGFNAFIHYPVIREDKVVGSVTIYSREKDAYNERHVELIKALPLSKAVLTAIYYEEREDLEFRLNLIRNISSAANNVQKVAEIIVTELGKHYEWENVSLFLIDEADHVARLLSEGIRSKAFRLPRNYSQSLDKGILGHVYQKKNPVNIGNVHDPEWEDVYRATIKGAVSELCLPIIRDGRVCWLLNIEDPRENAFSKDEEKALDGVIREVSELLQRSWLHHFLNATLQSASDAVIVTDSIGNINQVNPATRRILGYSKAEMMGTPLKDYFRDEAEAEDIMRAKYLPSYEVGLRRKNGGEIHVLLSASKLPEDFGGKVFIAKDLSIQKRVEELEYLGKMYYEISAQTTTPLTLAQSWLDRLMDESEDGQALNKLDRALRQLRKVELTYDRLALYDKAKEVVPYNELLLDMPEVLDTVKAGFPRGELDRINFKLDKVMPYLRGDVFQLSFCFETILSYLLRFASEDQKVRFRVSNLPGQLRIEISGFFPGPENEGFEKITKKSLVSKTITGMALGEPVIRKFIKNHKGTFHKPERKGEMIKFRIDLPTLEKGSEL